MKNLIMFFHVSTIAAVCLSTSPVLSIPYLQGYNPTSGFVPDKATAIKIAEAVWTPIYGKGIAKQKPYKATLINGGKVWLVVGTMTMPSDSNFAYFGGVAEIKISKIDGKVLYVNHGR